MFARDDEAVSEVIGFVLSFALSAMFLLIALSSFNVARNNTDSVVSAVELKAIADQVARRVVEAGELGQQFPNSTVNLTLDVPQDINGHPYKITASSTQVVVQTNDGDLKASATTFKLDAAQISVSGTVQSEERRVVVTYAGTGVAGITIHEA